jgi:hypothetical protein
MIAKKNTKIQWQLDRLNISADICVDLNERSLISSTVIYNCLASFRHFVQRL